MYEVLDSFLNVETWHTFHPTDERRFYLALKKIVREESFNADDMGAYVRATKGVSDGDDTHPFAQTIDDLTQRAWAVRDYLRYSEE